MGYVYGTYGRYKNAYRALVSKPKGKRPLVRTRYGRADKIKTDLKEIRQCSDVDWTHPTQKSDE